MSESRLPVRRVVVALPNGLTLLNLFFGVFAIVTAARGDYGRAALYIVIGGICDAFDGRIARATRTGTRFGEELDSLVDAISFGVAPALVMYFAVLRTAGWDWVFVFLFVACAVIRLARFNIEQAGRAKSHFIGLPSPMAGGTLATYYWFSQTQLYNQTFLAELPWQILLKYLMAALAFLMISNVPYPTWPTFSIRTWRGAAGLAVFLGLIVGLVVLPREFFFPLGVAYVSYGVLRAALLGLVERVDDEIEPATLENGDVVHLEPSRSTRRAHGRPPRPHRPSGQDASTE
jgi:CDP-diacylglycerol--serine O-phosphatidyltransferase